MRHTHSEPPTVASAWMLVQGVNNKVHGACAALPYMRQRPRRALDWVGVLGRAGQSWAGSLCWSPRPGWVGPGAWVGGLDRAGLEDWAGRWEERGAAQRLLLAAAADSLSAGGAAAEGRWTLNHNPHVNGVRCSRAPRVRRRRRRRVRPSCDRKPHSLSLFPMRRWSGRADGRTGHSGRITEALTSDWDLIIFTNTVQAGWAWGWSERTPGCRPAPARCSLGKHGGGAGARSTSPPARARQSRRHRPRVPAASDDTVHGKGYNLWFTACVPVAWRHCCDYYWRHRSPWCGGLCLTSLPPSNRLEGGVADASHTMLHLTPTRYMGLESHLT